MWSWSFSELVILLGCNQADSNLAAFLKCKLSSLGNLRGWILLKFLQVPWLLPAHWEVSLDLQNGVMTDISSCEESEGLDEPSSVGTLLHRDQGKDDTGEFCS